MIPWLKPTMRARRPLSSRISPKCGIFQFFVLAAIQDDAVGLKDAVGLPLDEVPCPADHAFRIHADDHDALKPAAGQGHVGEPDQVRLGVLHSGDRADAVAQAAWDVGGKIHVVHEFMPDPNIRVAVVHQQAGLADQTHEQPSLDIHQHNGKHHPDQGG